MIWVESRCFWLFCDKSANRLLKTIVLLVENEMHVLETLFCSILKRFVLLVEYGCDIFGVQVLEHSKNCYNSSINMYIHTLQPTILSPTQTFSSLNYSQPES